MTDMTSPWFGHPSIFAVTARDFMKPAILAAAIVGTRVCKALRALLGSLQPLRDLLLNPQHRSVPLAGGKGHGFGAIFPMFQVF